MTNDDTPALSPAQRRHHKRLGDINRDRWSLDDDQQAAVDRLVALDNELTELLERKDHLAQDRAEAIAVCAAKGVSWKRMSKETGKARITLQSALDRGD